MAGYAPCRGRMKMAVWSLFLLVQMALGRLFSEQQAAKTLQSYEFRVRFTDVQPRLAMSASKRRTRATMDIGIAETQIRMQRSDRKSIASGWLQRMRSGPKANGYYAMATNSSEKMTSMGGQQYYGSLSVGDEKFQMIIDTGSSDTWIVQENFTCVRSDFNIPIATVREACKFGPRHTGTFQYGKIDGLACMIRYGDGEFVQGLPGLADVSLAGITVKKQQICLIRVANWRGDLITSGILGLAYPLLTKAFNETSWVYPPGSPFQRKYDPTFTSMVKQNLVSPLFSMAMERKTLTGWLSLGGLPPVEHEPDFAVTPMRLFEVQSVPALATEYSYYAIAADGYVLGTTNTSGMTVPRGEFNPRTSNDTSASQFPVMIDSGTTLNYVPTALAAAYAAEFDPPAQLNSLSGLYYAPCNATPPAFGVTVAGQTFYAHADDLLQKSQSVDWFGSGPRYCELGISDAGQGPFILGLVFLNSVVSVFDVGKGEMRFAAQK